jgi:peptidoglycan/xylan/chitin deacetylase (PgdA/CDA1 family)
MIDADVRRVLRALDYKVILWDIDTLDWAHNPPANIAKTIINDISSGDIILMHDYIGYNSPTPEALKLFIPVLLEKGYKFVVVSELIGLDK